MKIVTAIDSFKGSLTSLEAGKAVKEALGRLGGDDETVIVPVADGGEGTLEALSDGLEGRIIELSVTGPLGKEVKAKYAVLQDNTAVIEMAQAAGLPLLSKAERDPMETTTYGVGELIRDAIARGCRSFIVGIGGSATNDGGVGMLEALGYEFLDEKGSPVPRGAKGLAALRSISSENVVQGLNECTFRVACDVTNPLCGPLGCSAVYAPQKGATPESVPVMDAWLSAYADISEKTFGGSTRDVPGSGAAGGLGFAFLTFTNATLERGVDIVFDKTCLEEHIKTADLVVTGEGRLDFQSVMGKTPVGVARLAKRYGKRVIAFCGSADDGAVNSVEHGIDAYFPIVRGAVSLEDAMKSENAYENLVNTAYQVLKLIKTF